MRGGGVDTSAGGVVGLFSSGCGVSTGAVDCGSAVVFASSGESGKLGVVGEPLPADEGSTIIVGIVPELIGGIAGASDCEGESTVDTV